MTTRDTLNKPVMVLFAISAAPLVLERMIGDTILGNVLLLGFGLLVALLATLVALVDLAARRTARSSVGFLGSAGLVTYVILRFYFDSVPAGYGP